MERAVAINKLGKLLGKSAGYRVNPKAATADERAAARVELVLAGAERTKLEQQKNERIRAILAADQEYQALNAAYKTAKKHADELSATIHSYKFTVGVSNSMFFMVKAQGDSWEDVIRQVEEKRNAA